MDILIRKNYTLLDICAHCMRCLGLFAATAQPHACPSPADKGDRKAYERVESRDPATQKTGQSKRFKYGMCTR